MRVQREKLTLFYILTPNISKPLNPKLLKLQTLNPQNPASRGSLGSVPQLFVFP